MEKNKEIRGSAIKRFEFTFNIIWKMLKKFFI